MHKASGVGGTGAGEFKERHSPPKSGDDFSVEKFELAGQEAENLERSIAEIDEQVAAKLIETERRLSPLKRQQLIYVFRMAKLHADGEISDAHVADYTKRAGVKLHKNQSVPCSSLVRAVVMPKRETGVQLSSTQRRLRSSRASQYASAIDYGLRKGMTEDEFARILAGKSHRKKPGGIDYLAARGRQARQAQRHDASVDAEYEAAAELFRKANHLFVVHGDFSPCDSGTSYCIMLVEVVDASQATSDARGIIVPCDRPIGAVMEMRRPERPRQSHGTMSPTTREGEPMRP